MAMQDEDPCAFKRQQVEHKAEEVAELEEALGEAPDDLPPALKVKLTNMLERAKGRLEFLRRELENCEAKG